MRDSGRLFQLAEAYRRAEITRDQMFFDSPRAPTINSVRVGPADCALVVARPVILFLYRFAPAIAWSDAPYSWHLVPEDQRTLPGAESPATRAPIQIVLVDTATGLVLALRALTLSSAITHALHAAILEQAAEPWLSGATYDAALADIYRRYPTSAELLKHAISKTAGGA
jgi:hypothetical protein